MRSINIENEKAGFVVFERAMVFDKRDEDCPVCKTLCHRTENN